MVFSIANFKGGVGKTTTAMNVGAGLAMEGYKVLLVDTDAQTNLSQSLGIESAGENLYKLYRKVLTESEHPDPTTAIIEVKEKLSLLPGALELAAADREFNGVGRREYMLEGILDHVKEDYDIIIIDCPPSLGILTINALAITDYVLIPVLGEYLPVKGIEVFQNAVVKFIVKEKINTDIQFGGILVTQFNPTPILSRELIETLEESFPSLVFKSRIRRNIALSEAQALQKDIYTHAPESNGSKDYRALTKEIIGRFAS